MPTSKTLASAAAFALKRSRTLTSNKVFTLTVSKTLASAQSFSVKISRTVALNNVFVEMNSTVYATNAATDVTTKLGTLLAGQTVLTDVALADGFYNLEVRKSDNFYDEVRSRVLFPLEIAAGVIKSQGIPNISELSAEITRGFKTKLRWAIPDSAFSAGLKFGIWRSATSPVVITGAPDFEVLAYDGLGKYSFNVTQIANEFFAVAAILGSDKGNAKEVLSVWSLTAPSSPSDQFAYKEPT